MSHAEEFARNGYFVVPQVLGQEGCAELLREIVGAFSDSPPTVIQNPAYRRHAPLPLNATVSDALTAVLEHGHDVLADFLKNEQELVELSSITVFPHAVAQPLHRDEANEGHYLASVFVNLAPTEDKVGALRLVPGSHRMEEGGRGAPLAIELAQGSAVFMNSKLLHCGGANTSIDRIRSVFYCTLGEPGLYGPPYSMLEEIKGQHLSLAEFRPQQGQRRLGWTLDSSPQLSPDCRLLVPLTCEFEELLLARNGTVCRALVIEAEDEFLVDVLQCIEAYPRELRVEDLADKFGVDPAMLVERFALLARDGWLRW